MVPCCAIMCLRGRGEKGAWPWPWALVSQEAIRRFPSRYGQLIRPGLGSLFNHSTTPNVSFTLSYSTYTIQYKTFRAIASGEELCIFYGHTTHFAREGVELAEAKHTVTSSTNHAIADDIWGGLDGLANAEEISFLASVADNQRERGSRKSQKMTRAAQLAEGDDETATESDSTRMDNLLAGSASSDSETSGSQRDDTIIPWDSLPWRKVTDIIEPSDTELSTCEYFVVIVLAASFADSALRVLAS